MSGLLKFGKNAAVVNKADTEQLPISGTPFTVDILEVLPSRLNPRLTHGTNYLKDSIRNIGTRYTRTNSRR